MVRGLRDFVRGAGTAHRDAFAILLCRGVNSVLRIESMIDEYLDALSEAGSG
jgi:hypothetical protein